MSEKPAYSPALCQIKSAIAKLLVSMSSQRAAMAAIGRDDGRVAAKK